MYGTPRLRSAFPSTPQATPQYRRQGDATSTTRPRPQPSKPPAEPSPPDSTRPLIPFDVLDAPSQRLLIVATYGILTAFRLWDYWKVSDDLDSTWLFLKWVSIDFVTLFLLPTFRIPWLEWAFPTTVTAFLLHAVMNGFLMFHIPIPVGAWLGALVKVAYDREIAVSERRVNPAEILNNASLILGKQIIQILPEGSAVLNPDRTPMCLDSTATSVDLPIRLNQTSPTLIELLRIDLETQETELITINAKQAKQMKRQADKALSKSDKSSPRTLHLPVKKTGVYQLQRVIDESKLEVQKRAFDTIVPRCPSAKIVTDSRHKCTGELSNLHLQVSGLPPFKVKYSKAINHHESSSHFQNVQPDDLFSPLNMQQPTNALVNAHDPQLEWAKTVEVSVPVNELMSTTGIWSYTIEEVQDASGNLITYKSLNDHEKSTRALTKEQQQDVKVHQRPKISVSGCDTQNPLKAPQGAKAKFPLDSSHLYHLPDEDLPLTINYTFAPESEGAGQLVRTDSLSVSKSQVISSIQEPGFYTLQSVTSQYCSGTVVEPASCLLVNPPRPDLQLESQDVADTCAGNPIGLSVDFELSGTPPFRLRYNVMHEGHIQPKVVTFEGSRGHLDLIPMSAGSFVYEFKELIDDVYGAISLKDRGLILTQNVKPAASAHFSRQAQPNNACLEEPVKAEVALIGEAPWKLDYEIVHGGKRDRRRATVEEDRYTLETGQVTRGGQYSIFLTSVTDKSGCKRSLNEESKFEVRADQARAKFGDIDGQFSAVALEGKTVKIPVRLQGVSPWTIKLVRLDGESETEIEQKFKNHNSELSVKKPGTYQLREVYDTCPGIVDPNFREFKISWIERPMIDVKDGNISHETGRIYRKPDVCQGDEDQLRLAMTGSPPYEVGYSHQQKPGKGAGFVHNKKLSAAIGNAAVHMDTSKAGENIYKFTSLSDNLYDHSTNKFQPLTVHQKVNPLPVARFENPGKTYGYCMNEAGGSETIPIVLEGLPPFNVEIGITHAGSTRPELLKLKVPSTRYDWAFSRRELTLGTHSLSIRKVSDSRGCESTIENDPSSIRIMVSDAPTITPLEAQTDYCVGEHISFSLSGQPPFEIFYKFQGHDRKATVSSTTNPIFRRIAEQPGDFTISALSDNASGKCRAEQYLTKRIHPMPTVKISKGRTSIIDIHEGGEAELLFEFTGTPPFEFTYTRSENIDTYNNNQKQKQLSSHNHKSSTYNKNKNSKKSSITTSNSDKQIILETHTKVSEEFEMRLRASDAGVYEVTSIRDAYCSFSVEKGRGSKGGKMLMN